MNNKQRKTLEAIFSRPTLSTVVFSDIERLLGACGAVLAEREGSRIKFSKDTQEGHAHRPHPGKEAKKYQIEGVREFLERLGVQP